jgi:hypothetical protein
MNKKGFFFTIDATLALVFTMTVVAMIFFYISAMSLEELDNNDLLEYSKSVLSVMEFDEAFGEPNLGAFIDNYTKEEFCFNATVYDNSLAYQHGAVKSGCNTSIDFIRVSRSFVDQDQTYFVELRGWLE